MLLLNTVVERFEEQPHPVRVLQHELHIEAFRAAVRPLSVVQRLERLAGHLGAVVDHVAVRPNVVDPEALLPVEGARPREQRRQLAEGEGTNEVGDVQGATFLHLFTFFQLAIYLVFQLGLPVANVYYHFVGGVVL